MCKSFLVYGHTILNAPDLEAKQSGAQLILGWEKHTVFGGVMCQSLACLCSMPESQCSINQMWWHIPKEVETGGSEVLKVILHYISSSMPVWAT